MTITNQIHTAKVFLIDIYHSPLRLLLHKEEQRDFLNKRIVLKLFQYSPDDAINIV